ncbi:phage major capsid protein, P2 family [Lysobacter brunescens]|uniref:Phage major capsid protein, P2 family n=1 Tax=Lysobacter brunescens TaxID=262323 RepID=A0ABW2YEU0_9GAMM
MDSNTRRLFDAYCARVAQANGVSSAHTQFTVTPAVEQRLEAAIRQDSSFLQLINIQGVRDISGQAIGVGTTGTIAGRTDTSGSGVRTPREMHALNGESYICSQTDFDTAIRYATLDAWSSQPNFNALVSAQIVSQMAEDRIMIGWNGTSVAATTNRNTNPLLQDVNKGWLQRYRDDNPERVMDEGVTGSGIIKIGGTNPDFANLDALVYQAVHELIHPRMHGSPRLRVMLGIGMLDEKYFPLINTSNAPSEQNALDVLMSKKAVGGVQALLVPFMPLGTIKIGDPANLSIYYQRGARRRHIKDEPTKNRIENYESSNEAYVVENYEFGCVLENIQFGDGVQQGGGD